MVSVAELAGFERLGVLSFKLLDVDVFEISLGRGGEADARGLEELDNFAGVAIDRAVSFIIDDQIEVEGSELLTVPAVGHQRLDGSDDDGGTEEFACAAGCLEDHGLELWKHHGEVLHGLLREFDTVHDEQDALSISAHQKAANECGAQQRLARAGSHFEEELAETFAIEELGNFVHRSDLVIPQNEVVLEFAEILAAYDFAFEGTRWLEVFQPDPFKVLTQGRRSIR